MKTLAHNLVALVAVLAATLGARTAQAASVEKQFLAQSPAIVKALQDKGYKNIGVLKFRVKKGDGPISDNVGTLNMVLANRLEIAMILANPNDPARQLKIAQKASNVAAKVKDANHTTAEGRAKFFSVAYPLAWGNEQINCDAFVTGIAQVAPNMKTMTIGILAFDKNGSALDRIVTAFDADVDPATLGEMGESFLLRGAFDGGGTQLSKLEPAKPSEVVAEKAAETAAAVKNSQATFPLSDAQSPIALDIFYDGIPMKIELVDGIAKVREPQPGQSVTFGLKRAASKERLAVVLKVNGENTLYKEKLPDFSCKKWILEPGEPPITIPGYQTTGDTAERFVVLTPEESKANAVNYGEDVGTITISVFREKLASDKPPADLPSDAAEDLAALTRGVFPTNKAQNLSALKGQLRAGEKDPSLRNLIVPGAQTGNATRTVTFNTDPAMVLSATIRYYHP